MLILTVVLHLVDVIFGTWVSESQNVVPHWQTSGNRFSDFLALFPVVTCGMEHPVENAKDLEACMKIMYSEQSLNYVPSVKNGCWR